MHISWDILYLEKNINHLKVIDNDACNFLTKCAMVGQTSTIVIAQDPDISLFFFKFVNSFANHYLSHYIIHTQHDCPSQMNTNLMIRVTKLTRPLICCCQSSHLRSFVRDNHAGSVYMMTSSNRNIFRVTGLMWGESIGHLWIPLTKASDVDLWCFLWSAPEQTVE